VVSYIAASCNPRRSALSYYAMADSEPMRRGVLH
jgi:hypothetical protein